MDLFWLTSGKLDSNRCLFYASDMEEHKSIGAIVGRFGFLLLLLLIGSLMWTGCNAPQSEPPVKTPRVEVLATTLQNYQPGTTTFAQFKGDAGLTAPGETLISTNPAMEENTALSPWKIYGVSVNVNQKGLFGARHKFFIYTVGDTTHPISTLTFTPNGELASITPVSHESLSPLDAGPIVTEPSTVSGHVSKSMDAAEVELTLAAYQAGKTIFGDFKRDAGLILRSGSMEVSPDPMNPFGKSRYVVPDGSAWRIYQVNVIGDISEGSTNKTWIFSVGTTERPISKLMFSGTGELLSITPMQ